MTNKQYFKDEAVRVSNTYMSADGTTTAETPKPVSWDSTKTQNWLTGLTTGFNVFRPVQQPTGNPYLGMGNNPGGSTPPPPSNYGYTPPKSNNKWILYTGIGLGVVAILIVTISAINKR